MRGTGKLPPISDWLEPFLAHVLSEAGPQTIRRAHKVHPITAMETEYSLWSRDVEADILPTCRELGIGFTPYSPLGRGFLTATIKNVDALIPKDRRREHPRFDPANIEKNVKLLEPLERIASAHGCKPAQVALAWLLSRPWSGLARAGIASLVGMLLAPSLSADAVAAPLLLLALAALGSGNESETL